MDQKLIATLSPYSTIILVGGWTGWHIQPIVSLTRHIKNTDIIPDFLWIGGSDSQEEKVAKEECIRFNSIPTLKLATTRSFKVLLYPIFMKLGCYKAWIILRWIQDKNLCIFSKGWPGSVAIGIAAWSLWIPLYIHESDTIPGRSNRILGKFATKIFLGFEWAKKYFNSSKCEVIGQILDPVFRWESPDTQYKIKWKTSKPHILVICGSQWSRAIFEWIIEQFSGNEEYEWIIALWKLNTNMQSEFNKISDCQALEWISQSDIVHLIQDTDTAITRWSATTLAELTSFSGSSIKLIIIPLPYSAGNHQYYNAREYQKIWHTLLEQQNLTELISILSNIIKHVWNRTENK
jgi:UDP-N-acetylglucosamine--N-acetylmuramyl-(pentapeptide) pyrophosphoryl-undecaprenol N-acetylglucosamine transferase